MYSAWKITIGETRQEEIIWGDDKKVNDYLKNQLEHEDFGSGFDGRTLQEITAIVSSLKKEYPNAREIHVK